MPPKRKTAFSADASPAKRRTTRSSGVLLPDATPPRPSIAPKKPSKTYARKSHPSPITEIEANPRKECEGVEESCEESSEDELNLSPSRRSRPLASSPSRKMVVEVTVLTKKRVASTVSPATKQKPPAERALRTSRTHLRSSVCNAEALSPSSLSGKVPAMRINDDHIDSSDQAILDDGPLLSLTETAKFMPSTTAGFTPSPNFRKRRGNPNEFSVQLQPSPKKRKAATHSRAPELPSTTRQASPARITGNPSTPSLTRESAGPESAPSSPSSDTIPLAASSPSKRRLSHEQTYPPQGLSSHLHPCFNGQKRAILRALHQPLVKSFWCDEDEESEDDELATNEIAFQQLTEVLNGTLTRGEGNSCLLLGPRGSGKTTVRVSISQHSHSHVPIC
jgi:hypothetical protein